MNIIDKIASDLKLDNSYIANIVKHSAHYYKDYSIPKRNGGKRYISQPSPELKTLQYWIVYNILNKLPVSKQAFAYKKGDSIKKHAEYHEISNFILHTDIQNFFNSIHPKHLYPILQENEIIFNELDIDLSESMDYIDKICFRKGSLCIGAVSSPVISNIIMFTFDTDLSTYCKNNNYIYSRYADDIYISSKKFIDKGVISYLNNELIKRDFLINKSKTNFYSSKYRRKITGLIITNDSHISIGTERRNDIKKMIYNKLVHGQGNSEQIMGYLSYLKDIEPDTYNNLIIKYSQYCDEDIITALKK